MTSAASASGLASRASRLRNCGQQFKNKQKKETMAILYNNGDLTIRVSRIDVLRIPPMEKNKVEIYLGPIKQILTCNDEEEAQKVRDHIYSLMIQE